MQRNSITANCLAILLALLLFILQVHVFTWAETEGELTLESGGEADGPAAGEPGGAPAPAYSPQPQTAAEVQDAIDAWEQGGDKPRWQYEVDGDLVPFGYICELAGGDGGGYYTVSAWDGSELVLGAAASEAAVQYDPQPQTMAEVQAAIDAWEAEGGQKPRWQYAVAGALMPGGYRCEPVSGDEDFGADYYTFFMGVSATGLPLGGDGFYEIWTAADLDEVRNDLGGKYRVCDNIDLAGYTSATCDPSRGWVGIGKDASNAFTGEFDGGGYTITGLWCVAVTTPTTSSWHSDQGLFGYTNGAKIYDVSLEVASMTATYQIGGLVGNAINGTTISRCTVTGVAAGGEVRTVAGGYAGGIVGLANYPTASNYDPVVIADCYVYNLETDGYSSTATSGNYAGGIAGMVYNTRIEGCVTKDVTVTANSYAGGITGGMHGASAVTDCIADEPVISTRSSYPGGVAGTIYGGSTVTSSHAYAPVLQAKTSYSGGFAGEINGSTVSGCTVSAPQATSGTSYSGGFAGSIYGSSTVSDCAVASPVCSSGTSYAGGFSGEIASATVTGCRVTGPQVTVVQLGSGGFVGHVSGSAVVSGCFAYDPLVTTTGTSVAGWHAGGFSGSIMGTNNNRATITGCGVENPDVTAATGYAGGFTGYLLYADAEGCYAAGGTARVSTIVAGGFGAHCENVTVRNCYAQVDVVRTGTSSGVVYVGGLLGYLTSTSSVVENSYATGSVTVASGNSISGLVGYKASGIIRDCYATGTVLAGGTYTGGLVGHNVGSQAITNCYFDTTTTRKAYAVGNATAGGGTNPSGTKALSTTQMISGVDVAFSFGDKELEDGGAASPWYIEEEVTYPFLYYQYNGHGDQERDYSLAAVAYADGDSLGQFRADFTIEGPVPFLVQSAGAAKAYFPYTGESNYGVSAGSDTNVPASTFSHDTGPYSLGGISATGIIGFASLPGAVKSSGRPVYDAGDPASYTYVGEQVEYKVTVTNHSTDYHWDDVVLADPLPEGVTLVDGTVTAEYQGGGALPVSANPGDTPHYAYNEATRELTVFLGRLDAKETGGVGWATVRFTADVGPEALSDIPLDPDADNIRNRGKVTGSLWEVEGGVFAWDYTARFDDRNTDPVFTLGVRYLGNGNTGGSPPVDGTFYLNGDQAVVLGPGTLENTGLYFHGWSPDPGAAAGDPGAEIYSPGDTIPIVYSDVVLYAVWDPTPPLAEEFAFYKVDGDSFAALPGVDFQLYACGNPGHGAGDHVAPGQPGSCWVAAGVFTSGADGLVRLEFGPPQMQRRYFLLAEPAPPAGYAHPSARWLLYLEDSWEVSTWVQGYSHYDVAFRRDRDFDGDNIADYYLPNYATNYILPEAGGRGRRGLRLLGGLLLGAGAALALLRGRKQAKDKAAARQEGGP